MNTVATVLIINKDVEGAYLKIKVSLQDGKVTLGDDLLIIDPSGNRTKRVEKIIANGSKRTYIYSHENIECELYVSKEGASLIKKGDIIKVGEGLIPHNYNTTQFRVAKSPI